MHPFGGTPKCPRCQKAVYLAEQVQCSFRIVIGSVLTLRILFRLLGQAESKSCHVKNFGTRDLRQANHPYRARSPSLSPGKTSNGQPQRSFFPPPSPTHPPPFATGNGYLPQSQANKSISPATSSLPHNDETVFVGISNNLDEECEEGRDSAESLTRKTVESPFKSSYRNPTGLSQIVGDDDTAAVAAIDKFRSTVGRSGAMRPITQTPTGTRYGVALGGPVAHITGSPRKWGGETPNCPKCGKSVYFAEQLHGPQGNGYALLGKAGG
ncbi:hypothetical protein HHX47_DHR8000356 [Lentinula edodes]|nr:hypothetical protein HHX47_DHR8000356 [Lentinula edodes]